LQNLNLSSLSFKNYFWIFRGLCQFTLFLIGFFPFLHFSLFLFKKNLWKSELCEINVEWEVSVLHEGNYQKQNCFYFFIFLCSFSLVSWFLLFLSLRSKSRAENDKTSERTHQTFDRFLNFSLWLFCFRGSWTLKWAS
jgi:hypothetical protein